MIETLKLQDHLFPLNPADAPALILHFCTLPTLHAPLETLVQLILEPEALWEGQLPDQYSAIVARLLGGKEFRGSGKLLELLQTRTTKIRLVFRYFRCSSVQVLTLAFIDFYFKTV